MLIVVSDLHVGATTALWPEGIEDGDGAPLVPNMVQREIWGYWFEFIQLAKAEAKRRKVHPALLINGDLVQGSHPDRDGQLVTDDTDLQRIASVEVIRPLLAICDAKRLYVTRGTGFHDGKAGGSAQHIAQALKARRNEHNGHAAHWAASFEVDGKRVSVTHHSAIARVNQTLPLQKVVERAKRNYAERGIPIADIFIRSHVHGFAHYDDNLGRHAFVTDPWQVPGEYAHKVEPEALPIVGGLWLTVDNGQTNYFRYHKIVEAAMPAHL